MNMKCISILVFTVLPASVGLAAKSDRPNIVFFLTDDPGETRDVSADHPEIVADLRRRMDTAVRELEANSRPIGSLPGAPVPATKKNGKKRDRQ